VPTAGPSGRGASGGSDADASAELRALYAETDGLTHGFTCDASTDCCRFGVTGREPYPTAVELFVLAKAVRARGGLPKRRSLPVSGQRRCPLLSDEGRCLVYAARPFGCRTFFCERARGPAGEDARALPRRDIQELARRIADLSARAFPDDPGPRPLSRATSMLEAPPRRR
jgi:Fe-S-cluster containining protein